MIQKYLRITVAAAVIFFSTITTHLGVMSVLMLMRGVVGGDGGLGVFFAVVGIGLAGFAVGSVLLLRAAYEKLEGKNTRVLYSVGGVLGVITSILLSIEDLWTDF